VQAWNALFAPKDTPKPVLDTLTDALDKALDDEQTRKRLLELGSVLPGRPERGQQALAALVKKEIERWSPIIKAAHELIFTSRSAHFPHRPVRGRLRPPTRLFAA
jgi:tripartite-type tricarboxylate transporter receptor subunit TctC